MTNGIINKENAEKPSPKPQEEWVSLNLSQKIFKIDNCIKNFQTKYKFEVVDALNNGHIILKTVSSITANERGILLLNLELHLKNQIDQSLTIWLQPVGDKSKLRQLRGIEIK